MSLFKQNENFLQSEFFLTVLNFFKGDTNIYFEYLTFFEKKKKKSFTEKIKIFVKIIYFFLIYIFFQIVLLHLNNHIRVLQVNNHCTKNYFSDMQLNSKK